MNEKSVELVMKALDKFKIELPSWGFANTGTRFGKFIQAAAATTIEEKFSDAAQVNAVTGACPTLALHVQWDLPNGLTDAPNVERLAKQFGFGQAPSIPIFSKIRNTSMARWGIRTRQFAEKRFAISWIASPSRKRSPAAILPHGSRTVPIIPVHKTFEKELAISRKASRKFIER